MTARYNFTTDPFGYPRGSEYSDITSVGDLETAVIRRIVVWHSTYITRLVVYLLPEPSMSQTLTAD